MAFLLLHNYTDFISIGFAFVYSLVLFLLLKNSLPLTFFFLGCSLILLLFILRAYPAYEIEEEMEEPSYPVFETLFFFITGFFVIFIIKADKKLGIAESLPIFFVFLGTLLILYLFFVKRTKPERRLTSLQTRMIIYKGMLTNYILVFCTFYQLIKEGGMAINKIYIIYLIAITLAPMIYARLLKKFLENKVTDVIAIGIALGFILMLWSYTFYFGVLVLTIFTSQLNLRLNQLVYTEANLPKDYRLLAKYRLTNVGSILHQLIMMFVMYVGTLLFKNVTIDEILQSYTYKNVDESTFQTMDMTKFVLIAGFLIALFILQKAYNKEKTV